MQRKTKNENSCFFFLKKQTNQKCFCRLFLQMEFFTKDLVAFIFPTTIISLTILLDPSTTIFPYTFLFRVQELSSPSLGHIWIAFVEQLLLQFYWAMQVHHGRTKLITHRHRHSTRKAAVRPTLSQAVAQDTSTYLQSLGWWMTAIVRHSKHTQM